jgi:response regulator RpfG family c-di-GMP phosphodiesterase
MREEVHAMTPHQVVCRRCQVRYRETHAHCCLCGRVFGSASAYERHQLARESRRRPATDARLAQLGLVRTPDGVWKRAGSYTATSGATRAATSGARVYDTFGGKGIARPPAATRPLW